MTRPSQAGREPVPLAALLLLLAIALAWGSGWPLMKYGVIEMPVFAFRWLTAILSGLCVLPLAAAMGQDVRLPREEIGLAVVTGLFNVTGWFYFSGLALTMMAAGRSSVLAYTMPLWAFLAGLALGREQVTPRRILGVACGLGAVALLAGSDLARLGTAPLGVLAIMGAAISWAIGTVIQKRTWKTPPMVLAGWQLIFGGIPLLILSLAVDSDPYRNLTILGVGAIAYTVLVGNVCGFVCWIRVVGLVPTSVASLGVLPVPMVGILSGALVLGEPVGWLEIGALALVTGALTTVLPMPKLSMLRFWR